MDKLSPRVRTLLFAGLALLALFALAATLNALTLEDGQPLPWRAMAPQLVDSSVDDDFQRFWLALFRVMLIVAWVVIPLYIILLIFSKDARRRLVRMLLFYLPIMIMLYILAGNINREPTGEELQPGAFNLGDIGEMAPGPEAVLPEFQPPAPWVTTLTIVLLAAAMTLVIAGVGYAMYRRSRRPATTPLQQIQEEAEAALAAIQAGGDLREVIIRCYLQMVDALREYRNIHRDHHMTPHEFQDHLERRGLPREPVRQLTQLFEQVRYGGVRPGWKDEHTAVASLNAIVAACQRTVNRE